MKTKPTNQGADLAIMDFDPYLISLAQEEVNRRNSTLESYKDRYFYARFGGRDDIARAVRFFAIDAPYVTGQVLAVDGGGNAKL